MATILIVDDLPANRKVLVSLLRFEGHRMLEAADGREGLAAVRAEHPDLVITDVLMPVMDGYEFIRQLRFDPVSSRIPVIFCTAHYGEREARELALASGVSDVVTKPAAADEVLRVVDRALSGRSERGAAADQSPFTVEFDREHLRLVTDKLSAQTGDLQSANARLRALINIGLELASERDSDRLLQSVCASARDLFGATYVTLGILDRHDRTVERCITCGLDANDWIQAGDAVGGLLGAVVSERRTMRGDHPRDDPAGPQFPSAHPEVQAYLVAPIVSPTHVYGWICLVGNDGVGFVEEDEQLVMALAGQVGRIYENGYLYRLAREERDRAQRYLDTGEVILLALDMNGRITLANRYACSILGWPAEELLGRDWIGTCHPVRLRHELRRKFQEVLAGDLAIVEHPILTRSGAERLIEWRNTVLRDDAGRVIGTFSSGTDITERRQLEEQFHQAQKMEALGQLAGGVAHDFNNLLTVILGFCELGLADLDPGDPRYSDVEEIQKAGARAARLTRQLLAFSRKEIIEPKLLDLNVVVADLQKMLGRLIGEDVDVVLALGPGLALVKADRGQVEQIVVNLAVNARDAMPKGGTLTIESANVELDAEYAKTHPPAKEGPHVMLAVSDSGTGMTSEVQARLFEPFFTTKEHGKGTGLGLATVHGIVARNGGSVSVTSEVGRGTSFKVYFPRADAAGHVVAPPPVARARRGTETVLVVDDADGLLELAKRLLVRQGYQVLVASNASEALQLFDEHASIDVLLTDVVMPGVSGPELTRKLAERRRTGLRVIYMSGYTQDAIVHHGVLNPGIAFLHKPFTSETLGRKIREVLDSQVSE